MKKLIVLLLAMAMILCAFSACSNGSDETQGTSDTTGSTTDTTAPEYDVISIADALKLCGEEGNITSERYYIRGTVEAITNPTYGAMVITDGTDSISVYGTYSADGSVKYSDMESKPFKGDEVLLYCILQNYNGTKEVKNAWLIDFTTVTPDVDESKYTQMSILDARKAESGTQIKTSGVVAAITYANGMIPSGVMLVDDTSSIYVYDRDLAARVQVGNQITILGSKVYWVLDSETSNAQKFGYKGCSQLESTILLENDNKTDNEYNKSWIEETTVKELLDTPVSEDITTKIYKVNALVKKVDGKDFVNYYFFDLDGETGSYSYSQCSGADFAWLDAYDGKICTVYLTALNAKSTASGCFFRLLPVEVKDEGFVFDPNNTAEHIVKYYGVGQFASSYTGDPALELITNVSSDLLGFKDAVLSYSSSDSSIVAINSADGKTVMNCIGSGKATVTVTGSYNGKTYSETVEITVSDAAQVQSGTVADAIGANVGDIVTVKGIVGPSLVNKTGLYLIDETGVIAVQVDDATMQTVELGQEIIIKARRHNNTKGGANYYGQTCLQDGEVLVNNYGNHDYATNTFITDKTLEDFYKLDVTVDYTTTVFVLKATIAVEETAFYTNINLISGGTKVSLYSSSADQYSWLKEFAGQEVTVEIAACNWNDKNHYKGCVLSVITDEGKIYNELNFNK